MQLQPVQVEKIKNIKKKDRTSPSYSSKSLLLYWLLLHPQLDFFFWVICLFVFLFVVVLFFFVYFDFKSPIKPQFILIPRLLLSLSYPIHLWFIDSVLSAKFCFLFILYNKKSLNNPKSPLYSFYTSVLQLLLSPLTLLLLSLIQSTLFFPFWSTWSISTLQKKKKYIVRKEKKKD